MESKRIVVALIEPPLPFGNAAARWFYVLLRGLVERGHRVTTFATCSKPQEMDKARSLFPSPDYDLRLYATPESLSPAAKIRNQLQPNSYMFPDDMRRDLDAELAKGYDILHLEQLFSGWLGVGREARSLVNVHHLVGIDLEGSKSPGWKNWLNHQQTFRSERMLVEKLRFFRSCSPRLVEPMRRMNPKADITTVPVGIDTSLYPMIPDDRRQAARPIVGVIGTMFWYPSYSAAVRLLTRLWPEVKRQVPEATAQVVGWAARGKLAEFLDLPDVEILENVPDMQPYFDRTNVLLYAPGRGSGMKIKILEAMAFGVPVVTTSEGVEGLPAEDGVHAGVCEDDAGLIERTVALLRDPERQNRQRHAARALIESHCGPKPTLDAIEAIYQRMLESDR